MRPDSPHKEDYEYERCGTCSLLLAYDLDSGRRYLQVRGRRTKADYAEFWDWLVTTYYADTPMIQVIQDNLNTHTMAHSMNIYQRSAPISSSTSCGSTSPPNTAVGSTWPNGTLGAGTSMP